MNIIETNLAFNAMSERKVTNRIILHNSGVTVRQAVEVIHNYHKNTNGWAGIGYHFYVRTDGSVYRGRPENMVGAHAGGSNSDSIGICFEGDYNQETMTEAQIKAGQELVAYLKEKYSISKVQRHSDVCNTSCPGANFPFDEIANATAVENKPIQTRPQRPTNDYEVFVGEVQKACGANLDYIAGPETLSKTITVSAKKNRNHAIVTALERYFKILGYYNGKIEADLGKKPIFGSGMTTAVKNYQRDNGCKIDGEITAGCRTWKKLLKLI